MQCVVLGASRGLGAALVDELLLRGHAVTAVARTPAGAVAGQEQRLATGRFSYREADLAGDGARQVLSEVRDSLPAGRICIVLNAALVASDVTEQGDLVPLIYEEASRLATKSLGLAVEVFGTRLRASRGVLVGISSISAFIPPVIEPRIAYPAAKAFLAMALRSLRVVWKDQVQVMTVVLGNIGRRADTTAPEWFIPSCRSVAARIAEAVSRPAVPGTLNIPAPVCFAYRFLNFLPDLLYVRILELLRRSLGALRGSAR